MKNAFILLGAALILVACDQSIEAQLQKKNKEPSIETQSTAVIAKANAEEKIDVIIEDKSQNTSEVDNKDKPTKVEETKTKEIALVQEEKKTKETTSTDSSKHAKLEKVETEKQVSPIVSKQENITKIPQSDKNITSSVSSKKEKVSKNVVKVVSKATKAPIRNNATQGKSEVVTPAKANAVTNTNKPALERNNANEVKENRYSSKNTNNDGTYDENGQLISTFTEEELRLGAQTPLTKDEIRYYKSLCRYAYMSEQDIIDNNCTAKKVATRNNR